MSAKIRWPEGFDPERPTSLQIDVVEHVLGTIVGHPLKLGTCYELTKTIMAGLKDATEGKTMGNGNAG